MTVSIEGTTPGIAVDGTGAVVNVTVTTGAGGGGGGVELGETSTTAYRGDRGKTAYDHSQVTTGNPHGTTAADVGADPAGTAAGLVDDLSGVSNQATARTNLGLGTAATAATGDFAAASHTHTGTQVTVDASGFNGNLTTSDDTVQEIAQKLDDLVIPAAGIADPGGANDDFLQRKAGAWTNRTVAQVKADLNLPVITTAVAGQTYGMGGVVGSDSAYLNALNKWWGCLCYLPAGSYDRVVFNVLTTGTSTWSMGIYPLNPATGLVDSGAAPLHNIGNVNLSLATGAISVTTSFTLSTPRLVWIGGSVSAYTSTATVRSAGATDAAITRLVGAPMGGTIAGGVPNGSITTGIRVAAGTGTAGVDNFPSGGEFAGAGPKIQVRAA